MHGPDVWETVPCPLCGADQGVPCLRAADRLYGVPGQFQLVRCRPCRHVYLNPRPRADSVRHFYPETYVAHHLQDDAPPRPAADSSPAATAVPWYLTRSVRSIPGLRALYHWLRDSGAEVIPDVGRPGRRGLDLGCADGRFLERLRSLGWEAEGIEIAAAPAQRARDRGFPVHIGSLEPGLFPPESFDAVFAWMVLEHLPAPRDTLREIRRILRPTGWLAASVPNFGSWESALFRSHWYALQLPTHLQQFTPRTLQALLVASGFRVARLIHQRNLLNFAGSWGLVLRDGLHSRTLGPKLVDFAANPTIRGQLALAPLARILSWLCQGGCLTVLARPVSPHSCLTSR